MHALLPLMKVVLGGASDTDKATQIELRVEDTHTFEYIPGIRASSTARGRGLSHRSGFHSSASSPQSALLMLAPRLSQMKFVPFGMGISVRTLPSTLRIGSASGSMVSCSALNPKKVNLVRNGMTKRSAVLTVC